MTTPDQFFGKYDQKFIDFDGNASFWCVDLYRQFVRESLNLPQSPTVSGAKDIWTTYLTEYFDRIENTKTNCPIKGDIVIWGSGLSVDGHVAICKDGTLMQFTSFDQNWPVGSPCHFVPHNYNGVLGWLRVKPIVPPYNCDREKAEIEALKLGQSEVIKQAVESALSLERQSWRSQLDLANQTISRLQFSLSEQVKFSTIIGNLWKKLTGGGA